MTLDELKMAYIESDLLGDGILNVCASSASDLCSYDRLKRDSETERLDLVSGCQRVFYLFNNSQSQLWLDGARFYI